MPLPQWLLLHTLAGLTIGALEASRFQFTATLVLSGLFIGIAQQIVLRRIFRPSYCWITVSAIGWLLGIQIMIGLSNWLNPIAARLTELVGGEVFWLNTVKQPIAFLGLGIAQSLMLQSSRFYRTASWHSRWLGLQWIAVSVAGGAVQAGSSTVFCAFLCPGLIGQSGAVLTTAIVYGVGWFGYSVVTAFLLPKLLF